MNTFLQNLRVRIIKYGYIRKIILTDTKDERILEAAKILLKEKIIMPILICKNEDVLKMKALGLTYLKIEKKQVEALQKLLLELRFSKIGTKDELTPNMAHHLAQDPLMYGMYMLHLGRGDGLVAGTERTSADVLKAGLWLIGKAEGIKTVSSSFYMIIPTFRNGNIEEEVLTFSDCAVVPKPTGEQLADIAIAAADARSHIVGDQPKIALLSYSTKNSGGDAESITLVREALQIVRTRRPELIIDGEIQADVALIESISERKAPGNLIKGKANVLIFPSLDAGNIAYKLVACLLPETQALGPILQGMKKPISDLSRGARVDDIVSIINIVASQVDKTRQ